ncbi:MAG: sugar phosphate isomerase/epimerase [candidate division KSB1 bacterium]|nr:sugar phosphate isomerase/epimerase [candidate division KSB1 bacterium]
MNGRGARVRVGLTIERYREIEPAIILGLVRLLGLESVEITRSVFGDLDRVVAKLGRLNCGFHLPIVCEDGWDFSTKSASEEIERLVRLINAHREVLHLRYAIAHPPEPGNGGKIDPEAADFLFENLRKLELPIYIENIPSLPLEGYREFYRQAESILGRQVAGMCYDGPHYLLAGVDPVAVLDSLDGHVGCVHLSDCRGSEDDHFPFGKGGAMPIEAIIRRLRRSDFRGVINLEIRPSDFRDIFPTIQSYLTVLRAFRPGKYLAARVRVALLYPLLRHVLA